MLGGAGLVTCLTFVWFSAPDLALTQLAVEVVTTVLFLLGLRWLPQAARAATTPRGAARARAARRARDLVLAVGAGAGLAALVVRDADARRRRRASRRSSSSNALPEGGGTQRRQRDAGRLPRLRHARRDHRARQRRAHGLRAAAPLPAAAREHRSCRAQQRVDAADGVDRPRAAARRDDAARGYMLVPAVLVRLLLPIAGVVAVYLFLRGHNVPGGGFVAGLVDGDRASSRSTWSAARSWVEARTDASSAALDRARPAARGCAPGSARSRSATRS